MINFEDNLSKSEIATEFGIDESELDGCEVLFAAYKTESYEGSALVLYTKEGVLYEVSGSHCSCNGLEGQWEPEATNLEALRMRDFRYYGFDGDATDILINLVFEKEVLES